MAPNLLQVEQEKQLLALVYRFPMREALESSGEIDGLLRVQITHSEGRLWQVADHPLHGVGIAYRVCAKDREAPRGWLDQAQHLLDERAFPGAVGSEQTIDLAPLHADVELVIGFDAVLVDLREVRRFDGQPLVVGKGTHELNNAPWEWAWGAAAG